MEVKKITTNSRRDFLNIYIFSRHLIQKKQIFQMEQCIKDQLFAKTAVAVHIVEEYMLSGQYTAEALMNEYRESIILELKEKSMLASNMFAQADIRYEAENVVCLELLDTIVSAGRKEEIVDLLKEVYSERFHIPAEIRVDYKEPDRTGSREYDEQRIQQEINAIFERRARQRGETPQAEGEEKKETEGSYDTSRPRERKEFKPRGEEEFKPRREANSNLVAKGNSSHAEKESTSHVGKGSSNLVKKETSSRDEKKEALPGMTGTESLEASSVGKEIRELRENSEETVSPGYRRRKKSNFIDS